jgi:hypothetical protein
MDHINTLKTVVESKGLTFSEVRQPMSRTSAKDRMKLAVMIEKIARQSPSHVFYSTDPGIYVMTEAAHQGPIQMFGLLMSPQFGDIVDSLTVPVVTMYHRDCNRNIHLDVEDGGTKRWLESGVFDTDVECCVCLNKFALDVSGCKDCKAYLCSDCKLGLMRTHGRTFPCPGCRRERVA